MLSKIKAHYYIGTLILLAAILPATVSQKVAAQIGSHLFPETGKSVGGRFLAYWQTNGGVGSTRLPAYRGAAGGVAKRRQATRCAILRARRI